MRELGNLEGFEIFEVWKFRSGESTFNAWTGGKQRNSRDFQVSRLSTEYRELGEGKENKFKTVTSFVRDYNRQRNLLATIELKSINFSCDFARMQLLGNDRRQSKRSADWKTYELGKTSTARSFARCSSLDGILAINNRESFFSSCYPRFKQSVTSTNSRVDLLN